MDDQIPPRTRPEITDLPTTLSSSRPPTNDFIVQRILTYAMDFNSVSKTSSVQLQGTCPFLSPEPTYTYLYVPPAGSLNDSSSRLRVCLRTVAISIKNALIWVVNLVPSKYLYNCGAYVGPFPSGPRKSSVKNSIKSSPGNQTSYKKHELHAVG